MSFWSAGALVFVCRAPWHRRNGQPAAASPLAFLDRARGRHSLVHTLRHVSCGHARYFGNDALIAIIKAVSLSSLILGVVVYWYSNHQSLVPRSIKFYYWWLSLIMIGWLALGHASVFSGRLVFGDSACSFTSRDDGLSRVAIYGAGAAGNQLVAALRPDESCARSRLSTMTSVSQTVLSLGSRFINPNTFNV